MAKGVWLISADQLSYFFLQKNWVKAPNIKILSTNGLNFERAYCASPLCVPGRYSLYTGMTPHYHKCFCDYTYLDKPTLFHLLSDNGIKTCGVGKMDFRGNQNQFHGLIDRPNVDGGAQDVFLNTNNSHSFLQQSEPYSPMRYKGYEDKEIDEQCEVIAQTSVSWLKENYNEPFFLYTSFLKPHSPWNSPKRFWDLYENRKFQDDKHGFGERAYAAAISCVDYYIGVMLKEVFKYDFMNEVMIIFFADHGDMAGTLGMWGKHCLFEDAVRVPLTIFNGTSTGINTTPVSLLDIFPTVCHYFALNCKSDGIDLFQKKQNRMIPIEIMFSTIDPLSKTFNNWNIDQPITQEEATRRLWRCVICDEWKFITYAQKEKLFNLKTNDDLTNIHKYHPNIVKSLRNYVNNKMPESIINEFY